MSTKHVNFRLLSQRFGILAIAFIASGQAIVSAAQMENAAFRVSFVVENGAVAAVVEDVATGRKLADGEYYYAAVKADKKNLIYRMENPTATLHNGQITIHGRLAGLDVDHSLSLPLDRPILEERIVLRNDGKDAMALSKFEAGFTLRVTDDAGKVLPEMEGDHWAAVPFLRRADFGERRQLPPAPTAPFPRDIRDIEYNFSIRTILEEPGFEYVPVTSVMNFNPKRITSPHRFAEGWAWMQGQRTIGIFTFNQKHMTFSTVTPHDAPKGKRLRFGGASLLETTLGALRNILPGTSVDLGITRFQPVEGGYNETAYAFRSMLDEKGCRFPKNYNPPVHWNQLYDMGGWAKREKTHTRAAFEKEAVKAVECSCEALYLDPGWDTSFGSLRWGPWLGSQREFINQMHEKYSLKVGLHCPMPPWASGSPKYLSEWPEGCRRQLRTKPLYGPRVCMGSKQFLDEAATRMLMCCEAGAIFLMFDGTWWNGPCEDERHGHPIPYTYEDHMQTCVELARRVHEKYPKVLIEMHDMLAGGEWRRMTPVYYQYGLPGSYDENWGFELMWNPMINLKHGTSDALYYYALGCNVPMYLHIRLSDDNEHALSLWWYASTCRHLGIGGKPKVPAIADVHRAAMKKYRQWEEFFKRGEFYGIDREIHFHVLPEKKSFTVNIFNLSNQKRTICGSIELKNLGLDPSLKYVSPDGPGAVSDGRYHLEETLPAWGARVGMFGPSQYHINADEKTISAKY